MKKKQTLPKLKAKLQIVFNKYIRLRDSEDGCFVCISCGEVKRVEDMDAGHYYATKGYDGLRFNEYNVNGECSGCNRFDESHLIGYGKNLLDKYDLSVVNLLETAAAEYKKNGHKWYRDDLEEMINYYKNKVESML